MKTAKTWALVNQDLSSYAYGDPVGNAIENVCGMVWKYKVSNKWRWDAGIKGGGDAGSREEAMAIVEEVLGTRNTSPAINQHIHGPASVFGNRHKRIQIGDYEFPVRDSMDGTSITPTSDLLVAAYNFFDQLGKAVGMDATELAKGLPVGALIDLIDHQTLKDVERWRFNAGGPQQARRRFITAMMAQKNVPPL